MQILVMKVMVMVVMIMVFIDNMLFCIIFINLFDAKFK